MTPRLKSEIWVQAVLRQNAAQGVFGAVLHRGHEDAGAVMVVLNHCNGTYTLLAPPPGPAMNEAGERHFEKRNPEPASWHTINEWLQKALGIDSDLWVIELEDKQGWGGLLLV